MPVAMRPWLWGLSAVLLLGLVLMHHVPGHQEHGDAPVVAHAAIASPEAASVAESGCPCPDDSRPPAVSELVHLCLAVLAAAVLLLAPLLRGLAPSASTGGTRRLAQSVLDFLRPPPPVPRRLAALGVLRC